MRSLFLLAVAGFIAQLVDGSLGMAYGVTSTTLLLAVGLTPAIASASVHIAEVGTTAASGVSHWRFGNVDWSKIGWMAVPGALGAFVGAMFLTSTPRSSPRRSWRSFCSASAGTSSPGSRFTGAATS